MTESFLLIAHADEPRVTLLDHRYHVVRTFEMPGCVAVLGASSDKDYGFTIHRDDDCVTIIDPQHALMKGIVATGKQPTHFSTRTIHTASSSMMAVVMSQSSMRQTCRTSSKCLSPNLTTVRHC